MNRMKTQNETTGLASEVHEMTKQQMANTLVILLDMDNEMSSQFMKMSIPALKKTLEGINKNWTAYGLAKQEAKDAKKEAKIANDRSKSYEVELRKLKTK
ncbi:MAG: hypothetical protein [Bacteriophage sp.]|nr:MAG: hypothetical protein [Bacteriophage sp.]